jgi:phosphomethylpyrimidine synthase
MQKTQLDFARSGILTDSMKEVALVEGVTPEFIRSGIADGNIIICHNLKRVGGRPLAVGKGLRTKVNANIGTSSDDLDISKELEKARVAVKYGADAIMDLSTGGPVDDPACNHRRNICLHRFSSALPGCARCRTHKNEGDCRHDR